MDDCLLLVVGLIATAIITSLFVKLFSHLKRKREETERAIASAQAALDRDRALRDRMKKPATSPVTQKKVEEYRKEVESKPPTHFASPTQSVQQSSDDGFVNGMLTGMLIDSLTHSHHHSESPVIESPKVDTRPSWGLDDSDSRKSISDSMDTSSSWSSSSSSSDSWSSSSSDSGPSSDW
jgi:hypothetical protein